MDNENIVQISNNFFNQLDGILQGEQPVKAARPARRQSAKESLDGNSSQEEFIMAIATAAARFISDNRNAFNASNDEAAKEFAEVFAVSEVQQKVSQILTDGIDTQEEETNDEELTLEPLQEDDEQQQQSPASNDELVSDDVMKLLDE